MSRLTLALISVQAGLVRASSSSHEALVTKTGGHHGQRSYWNPKGCGGSRPGGDGLAHPQVPPHSSLAALGIKKTELASLPQSAFLVLPLLLACSCYQACAGRDHAG